MIPLLEYTKIGIFCSQGNFFIDPWRGVDYAIITHAHADHARYGSKNYLCSSASLPLLKARLGKNICVTAINWGQKIVRNGVEITLFPAGHILGSAQIRVAANGQVWVVTGDFKHEIDGVAENYEPVKCTHLIMESTFGLPIYNWQKQEHIKNQIVNWHYQNIQNGCDSVLFSYSLGKAQRLLHMLFQEIDHIFTHESIDQLSKIYANCNRLNPNAWLSFSEHKPNKPALFITPPNADNTLAFNKLRNPKIAMASGWMAVKNRRQQHNLDAGFVLSDHADWQALIETVRFSDAEYIYLTHGFTKVFAKYLTENGFCAHEVYSLSGAFNTQVPQDL